MPATPEPAIEPFGVLHRNERQRKPRTQGVTEIRGPYKEPDGLERP